jgi:hypothetical protein
MTWKSTFGPGSYPCGQALKRGGEEEKVVSPLDRTGAPGCLSHSAVCCSHSFMQITYSFFLINCLSLYNGDKIKWFFHPKCDEDGGKPVLVTQ